MKTTSSLTASTAKAVSRSDRSETACDQRARTAAPTLGIVAPLRTAKRCGQGAVQPSSTAVMSATSAVTEKVTAAPRTRPWPRRSTYLASGTAPTAVAATYAAEIPPASAYDPVRVETSTTIPRVIMLIGSLATRPVALNAKAPGIVSTRR
jgi:hypothetical protein